MQCLYLGRVIHGDNDLMLEIKRQVRLMRACYKRYGLELFIYFFVSFVFLHTSTFQLLDKPWSQVSSLLLPGSCLQFLSRIGFSNPTARRLFIDCC